MMAVATAETKYRHIYFFRGFCIFPTAYFDAPTSRLLISQTLRRIMTSELRKFDTRFKETNVFLFQSTVFKMACVMAISDKAETDCLLICFPFIDFSVCFLPLILTSPFNDLQNV